jgi:hypothetical protein
MKNNTNRQAIAFMLAATLACSTSSASQVSIASSCDSADYSLLKEVEHEGRRYALVGSCAEPGSKSIVRVTGPGAGDLVGTLVTSDPGIEKFVIRPMAGHSFLVFENAVEPTGDEETHYIALVDVAHDVPRWLGEAWSFSKPELFVERDAPYLGVSVNSSGTTHPETAGWPLVFAVRDAGLVYVPLGTVPIHACSVARQASAGTGGNPAGDASGEGLSPATLSKLHEHCGR